MLEIFKQSEQHQILLVKYSISQLTLITDLNRRIVKARPNQKGSPLNSASPLESWNLPNPGFKDTYRFMYIFNFITLSYILSYIYILYIYISASYQSRNYRKMTDAREFWFTNCVYQVHPRLIIYRFQSHLLSQVYKLYSFLFLLWIQGYLRKYSSFHTMSNSSSLLLEFTKYIYAA